MLLGEGCQCLVQTDQFAQRGVQLVGVRLDWGSQHGLDFADGRADPVGADKSIRAGRQADGVSTRCSKGAGGGSATERVQSGASSRLNVFWLTALCQLIPRKHWSRVLSQGHRPLPLECR
jgi:hypothetical protein